MFGAARPPRRDSMAWRASSVTSVPWKSEVKQLTASWWRGLGEAKGDEVEVEEELGGVGEEAEALGLGVEDDLRGG
jgi:hypothetical protein